MKPISLAILSVSFVTPALADSASDLKRVTELSNRYNECVYYAAVERLGKNNGDISAAAEDAFPSCATEARQITAFMRRAGATKEQIADIFAEKHAGIKAELRKMANEARGLK